MASLVATVQFARDRFHVYDQMATEKVQHGEYGLSSVKQMPDEKAANEAGLQPTGNVQNSDVSSHDRQSVS